MAVLDLVRIPMPNGAFPGAEMSGLLQHILRSLMPHAERFAELPLVTVPSAAAADADADVEHWNDLFYMWALLDEIEGAYRLVRWRGSGKPSAVGVFPQCEECGPWPVDEARLLLTAWRLSMSGADCSGSLANIDETA